jgi:hypothetical protein
LVNRGAGPYTVMRTHGYLLELRERLSMNYRNLKIQDMEGPVWGLLTAIVLTVGGTPPAFALVVGIIFGIVAVFVLSKPGYQVSNV